MLENKEELSEIIRKIAPEMQVTEFREQLSVRIDAEHLIDVCNELKLNSASKFDMLLDITAIDRVAEKQKFEVVYFLYSLTYKYRLRLKIELDAKKPECQSITNLWESANWYERETFDMYGIKFIGHPYLRRFYMPEDFVDPVSGDPLYPLRKDFPLAGIPDSLPLPPYPEKYGDVK